MTSTHSPTSHHSPAINTGDDLAFVPADPRTLIIGSNVRIEPGVDDNFVASIAARGVRTAISAYRNDAGQLVVLRGQRRTLAAVMVDLQTVPVLIEREPTAEERLIDQVGENDHRAGLMPAEHVAAYEQLEALGFTAEQIADRLATPAGKVKAGLSVARSKTARDAAGTPGVDLMQAATLAEFEDNEAAVERLLGCIKEGRGFDHWVRHLRDEREEAQEKAGAEQKARDEGLTVLVDRPKHDDAKKKSIDYLKNGKKNMTPAAHKNCPGRAVVLFPNYPQVEGVRKRVWHPGEYCVDWKKNGHTLQQWATAAKTAKEDLSAEEKAAETAKRRRVIQFNSLWRSATTVRHEFLQALLERKKIPKGAGGLLAAAFTSDRDKIWWALQGGSRHAHQMFGLTKPEYGVSDQLKDLASGAGEDRAHVIALGMILAGYEDNIDEKSWRLVDGGTRRYLLFLQGCGYELADVEEVAAGLKTEDEVAAERAEAKKLIAGHTSPQPSKE